MDEGGEGSYFLGEASFLGGSAGTPCGASDLMGGFKRIPKVEGRHPPQKSALTSGVLKGDQ